MKSMNKFPIISIIVWTLM